MICGSFECSVAEAKQTSLGAGIQTLTTWGGGRGSTKKRSRKKSPNEIHGAFTRAQQDSRLYNLKLDINNLKQELQDLAIRRELLQARAFVSRANSNASVLRTVGRYFHGFEPGYRGDTENRDQSAFVRSIVDEDFSLGVTGLGVEMLLEQWLRYTQLFHVRETFLHSADVITSADDDTSFVVAKCVMDFRGVLTRAAVDMIFPTACRDPELLLQALGREIAIPMLFHLFFNEDGRLVRHDAVADFFGAVREALGGDISTAVRFIADAHVGQESMLGAVPSPARSEKSMMEAMRQKKLRTVDISFGDDGVGDGEPLDEWASAAPSIVSPSSDGSRSNDEQDLVDSYDGSDPDPEEQRSGANVALAQGPDIQSVEFESGFGGVRHSLSYLLSPR